MKEIIVKDVKNTLKHPAFLIGNGVNYLPPEKKYEGLNTSWDTLLISTFPTKIKDKHNLTDVKDLPGLTYPEIAELSELYDRDVCKDKGKYRNKISNNLLKIDFDREKQNLYDNHKNIVDFAKKIDCPILTTNYDHLLLKPLSNISYTSVKALKDKRVEQPFFIDNNGMQIYKSKGRISPINMYFRELPFTSNDNITETFAIWPIHGSKRFPGSICINNDDYARNTGVIEDSIKNIKIDNDKHPWNGKYEWPRIFLNNDLIIIGLMLDYSETDLRALLTKRKMLNNSNSETIYIYRKADENKEMPIGKKLFFEKLGITCIGLEDKDIYTLDYISEKETI